MLVQSTRFSEDQLARFRALQRLSFSILEETAAGLVEGQTERDVARALVRRYRAEGAGNFFHLPVVLFGERCALPGDWTVGKFFPKERPLRAGDCVILDAAPLFGGYLVDTSYSVSFGENSAHRQMMRDLSLYRRMTLEAVNAGQTFRAIAADVAADLESHGYEPVHCKHPGEVLGHRAVKTAELPFKFRLQGFDGLSLGWFILKGRLATSGLGRDAPTWNANPTSDHPPHDGLWLVEPHAGQGEVGAKWEEILVIENGAARWLDEDAPHLWQWAQIERGAPYAARSKVLQ